MAPAYCMVCDRPIATGPTCEACLNPECEHEFTVTEEDNWGHPYTVCEECGEEVEVDEDTRDYEAIMEYKAEEAFEARCRRHQ